MRLSDYIAARDAAVAQQVPLKYTAIPGDPAMRLRLELLAGAMLEHFLPALRGSDVRGIVEEVLRNQECAAYESNPGLGQRYGALLDELVQLDDADRFRRSLAERSLFCAFHVDSYRLVIAYLRSKSERPVGLLVTPDVVEAQQELVNAVGAAIAPDRPDRTAIPLFDAESIDGLAGAIAFLRKGGILVVYIDGNSGFGGMSARPKNMVRIPFLDAHIMARLGVAQLSSRLRMPIVPVYIENLADGRRLLRCLPELPAPANGEREAHVATTRELYAILERHVRARPESWEGWLYVNRFLERLPGEPPPPRHGDEAAAELAFAHQDYVLLPYPGKTVLMCKRTLSYRVVSGAAVDVLTRAVRGPIDAAAMPPETVAPLRALGVLVPAHGTAAA